MRRDPTEFRKRFALYKLGKSPYKNGRPVKLDGGTEPEHNVSQLRPWSLDGTDELGNYEYVYSPFVNRDIPDAGGKNVEDHFYNMNWDKPDTEWLSDMINEDYIWKLYNKTLPDIVITPDKSIPSTISKILEKYPDVTPELRDRLLLVYRAAGSPEVRLLDDYPSTDPNKRYKDSGKLRAYARRKDDGTYDYIAVNTIDDLLAELSHPLLELYGNNEAYKEFPTKTYLNIGKKGSKIGNIGYLTPGVTKVYYDADKDPRGGTRYDYPDRFEGETHGDFLPLLSDYVAKGTIPKLPLDSWFNVPIGTTWRRTRMGITPTINDSLTIVPTRGIEELVDSAASYNRQHLKNRLMYYGIGNENDPHYYKGKTPLRIPKFDSGTEPYTPYNKSIASDLGNGTILLPAGYSFTYGFNPDAPTGQQSGMYIYKSDDSEHTPVEFKPIIQSNDPDKTRSDYWGNVGRDYMYHGMNTEFGKTMQDFATNLVSFAMPESIFDQVAGKALLYGSKLYKNIKLNNLGKNYNSTLDWKNWLNERPNSISLITQDEIDALNSRIPEYLQIEQNAKQNKTWLKMPDGSIWKGDPRSWVLMLSKDFKKAFEKIAQDENGNPLILTHGTDNNFNAFDENMFGTSTDPGDKGVGIYTNAPNTHSSKLYGLYQIPLVVNSKNPLSSYDYLKQRFGPEISNVNQDARKSIANGFMRNFHRKKFNKKLQQNQLRLEEILKEYPQFLEHDLLIADDYNPGKISDAYEVVIPFDNPVKSLLGNTGEFNLNNNNIYRSLIPFGIASMPVLKQNYDMYSKNR